MLHIVSKILITGTTSGIGFAAKEYFKQDHEIIGIAKSGLAHESNYTHYQQDLARTSYISPLLNRITKEHKDIDCIILNAGFGIFKELDQFSESEIIELLNVNLLANILITKALLPNLRNNPNSKIFFIGSEASIDGQKKGSIYCASKFGLRGFVLSLQKELSKNNTQISLINPGMVKSNFYKKLNFTHGESQENYINPIDIIKIIDLMIEIGNSCLVEEVNLRPYKKVIIKK
jgi:3-hydroxy acid dehydrogenase / malonic semialdehyde reductase